jgi:ariadne-1
MDGDDQEYYGEEYGNDDEGYGDYDYNAAGAGGEPAEAEMVEAPNCLVQNSDILDYQDKLISQATNTLQIPKHIARALLNTCKWNLERLKDRFWDDPDGLYKECGLKPPGEEIVAAKPPVSSYECSCCLEDTTDYLQNPTCGHYFCKDCWSRGLEVEIKGGNVFKLKCFHRGCTELIPDDIIKQVVSPDTLEKYKQYLSSKFVDQASDMRWCISPGCKNAISQSSMEGNLKIGVCPCGTVFCWNPECAAVAHCPASCDEYRKWLEKNGSADFQSQKWILENTKKMYQMQSTRIETRWLLPNDLPTSLWTTVLLVMFRRLEESQRSLQM